MNIKCLVIDDEPSSQQILKKFISDVDFLELAGVCNSANDALLQLKKHPTIDLIFLDINMPKISGLSFYKSLKNPPEVIFTTAYSQYAVDGFEVNAIDYLLKPFSFDRFLTAVNKLEAKKTDATTDTQTYDFLLIKANKVLHKVLPNTILFIEASGDYVKVYLEDQCIVTNTTFSTMLESLPKMLFIRTHKSFAVNLEKIKSVAANQVLTTNHKIPIGQKFRGSFLEFLEYNKRNTN
tara:strand:+ start:2543 stop:3253 length:711 start_codon:yes stop_codon:yes gene_type:complete